MGNVPAIIWENGTLKLLDQRRLPLEIEYVDCEDHTAVARAIKDMVVRGAPAIGATAAYGLVIAARLLQCGNDAQFHERLAAAAEELRRTRPTAVNLDWALKRMMAVAAHEKDPVRVAELLEHEAGQIAREDIEANRAIGRFGEPFVKDGDGILTHCNAGALATVGFGTALGVIRSAHEAGKHIRVFADETRPYLQGARLTSWELMQDGIDVTLITDNMAAWVMSRGKVNLIVVGADRIAANGDVANKIGTYGLAVLANAHNIPFYVAAPLSTIDLSIPNGKAIPIEERPTEEVTHLAGRRVAPEGVKVFNPAFDVTPANLVTAVITDRGVFSGRADEGLKKIGGCQC